MNIVSLPTQGYCAPPNSPVPRTKQRFHFTASCFPKHSTHFTARSRLFRYKKKEEKTWFNRAVLALPNWWLNTTFKLSKFFRKFAALFTSSPIPKPSQKFKLATQTNLAILHYNRIDDLTYPSTQKDSGKTHGEPKAKWRSRWPSRPTGSNDYGVKSAAVTMGRPDGTSWLLIVQHQTAPWKVSKYFFIERTVIPMDSQVFKWKRSKEYCSHSPFLIYTHVWPA